MLTMTDKERIEALESKVEGLERRVSRLSGAVSMSAEWLHEKHDEITDIKEWIRKHD